jgi:hypothetical protein
MRGISRDGVSAGFAGSFTAEHVRQSTTPRKLQMTQMKVPHEAHG